MKSDQINEKLKLPTQMTDLELLNFGETLALYITIEIKKTIENYDILRWVKNKKKVIPTLGPSSKFELNLKSNEQDLDLDLLTADEQHKLSVELKCQIQNILENILLNFPKLINDKIAKIATSAKKLENNLKNNSLWLSPVFLSNIKLLEPLLDSNIDIENFFIDLLSDFEFQKILLNTWKNYDGFQKREKYLKYTMQKLSEKDYIAVVLTGITQYEGILRERNRSTGEFVKSHSLLNNVNSNFPHIKNNFITRILGPENHLNFAKNEFFEKTCNISENTFNRHSILHGDSLNFDNKRNAVITILLIDSAISCEIYYSNKTTSS